MTDGIEERLRDALDGIRVPDDVRRSTLAAVEAARDTTDDVTDRVRVVATPRRHNRAPLIAAACLLVALVVGIGGFTAYTGYTSPTAYVDIDVNPSVTLSVNRFDIVVAAYAYDEEGRDVLDTAQLAGRSIDEALGVFYRAGDTYIDPTSYVAVAVSGDDDDQVRALVERTQQASRELPCEVSCSRASTDRHEQAQAAGMGVRRFEAAMRLMELDPTVTLDECSAMTMRELSDRIAALGGAVDDDEEGTTHGGAGAGQGDGAGGHHGEMNGKQA